MLERRHFLTGLAGLIAAPAIVRASSLMAVKPWDDMETDFSTDNLLVKATERYSWFLIDRRWGDDLPPMQIAVRDDSQVLRHPGAYNALRDDYFDPARMEAARCSRAAIS